MRPARPESILKNFPPASNKPPALTTYLLERIADACTWERGHPCPPACQASSRCSRSRAQAGKDARAPRWSTCLVNASEIRSRTGARQGQVRSYV